MTEWNCYCPSGDCHQEIVAGDPNQAALLLQQHLLERHEVRMVFCDLRLLVKAKPGRGGSRTAPTAEEGSIL